MAPPLGIGGVGRVDTPCLLHWDPNPRTGSLAGLVAGFDGHEMAGIRGQNLVMVG